MVPKRHWFEHEDKGEAIFNAVKDFEEIEFETPIYYVRPNGEGRSFYQIPRGISYLAERDVLFSQISLRHLFVIKDDDSEREWCEQVVE